MKCEDTIDWNGRPLSVLVCEVAARIGYIYIKLKQLEVIFTRYKVNEGFFFGYHLICTITFKCFPVTSSYGPSLKHTCGGNYQKLRILLDRLKYFGLTFCTEINSV